MRIALPFEHRSRITLVGSALVAVVAVSALAVAALTLVPGGGSGGDNLTPDAQAADPAVKFPITGLPGVPSNVAVAADGTVWVSAFDKSRSILTAFPANGEAHTYELPAPPGSGGWGGGIAIDSRGHVLLGYAAQVVDFDPEPGTYKEYALPPLSIYHSKVQEFGGPVIMEIEEADGTLYVGRGWTASVTRVDLAAGKVDELPLPADFGGVYDLAVSDGYVWVVSHRFGGSPAVPPQTGRLSLATGSFEYPSVEVFSIAAGPDGAVYGVGLKGLYRLDKEPELLVPMADLTGAVGWGWDLLSVDEDSGLVWLMVRGGGTAAVNYDPESGRVSRFHLPTGLAPYPRVPAWCGEVTCPSLPPLEYAKTRASSIAPGPDASLYFADAEGKRIGLIDPN